MKLPALAALALSLVAAAAQSQPRPAVRRDRALVVAAQRGPWAPTCTASIGCAAPAALPRCASAVTADFVPVNLAGDGGRVMLGGRLRVETVCSTMACPAGQCCNGCSATVTVESEGRTYELGRPGAPTIACSGDDSGLCCATAVPAVDVRVVGVLRTARSRGGRPSIEGASLCLP